MEGGDDVTSAAHLHRQQTRSVRFGHFAKTPTDHPNFGNFARRPMAWCHCSPTTTDRKTFLWTRDLWTTQIIWSVLLFPHRTKQSRAAICPCLAFSAQLDLSFGRLWNLDVEWNRHDCDPATFDLMTWRLWSWSTWNYAPRRFQILNMVLESDVENSAWNRSLGGAWLWGRGLEFEPPPCSGHPALACIYTILHSSAYKS